MSPKPYVPKRMMSSLFALAQFSIQVYFGFSTLMFLFYLREEQEFLLGQRPQPMGESLLEKGDVTIGKAIYMWSSPCAPASTWPDSITCVIYAFCSDCDIQRFVSLLLDADGAGLGSPDCGSPAGGFLKGYHSSSSTNCI